jgi:hypothetical protein
MDAVGGLVGEVRAEGIKLPRLRTATKKQRNNQRKENYGDSDQAIESNSIGVNGG